MSSIVNVLLLEVLPPPTKLLLLIYNDAPNMIEEDINIFKYFLILDSFSF